MCDCEDFDECTCICHTNEHVMHCMPCCNICTECGKNIKPIFMKKHLEKCKNFNKNVRILFNEMINIGGKNG
jgi:hypothetical protein